MARTTTKYLTSVERFSYTLLHEEAEEAEGTKGAFRCLPPPPILITAVPVSDDEDEEPPCRPQQKRRCMSIENPGFVKNLPPPLSDARTGVFFDGDEVSVDAHPLAHFCAGSAMSDYSSGGETTSFPMTTTGSGRPLLAPSMFPKHVISIRASNDPPPKAGNPLLSPVRLLSPNNTQEDSLQDGSLRDNSNNDMAKMDRLVTYLAGRRRQHRAGSRQNPSLRMPPLHLAKGQTSSLLSCRLESPLQPSTLSLPICGIPPPPSTLGLPVPSPQPQSLPNATALSLVSTDVMDAALALSSLVPVRSRKINYGQSQTAFG